MASTVTIQNTINWLSSFIEQQPSDINGMEPALSSANLILQTILGPPFIWPWNRSNINFTATSQDTTVSGLYTFGFLEGGTVTPVAGGKSMAIAVRQMMEEDASSARPRFVSPLIDDGAGNITFRLMPGVDQNYNVNLLMQRKAPTLLSCGFTWYPIPDEKRHIYQWGLLALMSLIADDERFNAYNQKFVLNLLAEQGGLSEMERNLFLANWTRVLSQLQSQQLGTAQRYKAREV